ncbi:MAG: hypothetical protein AAB971_00410 [Patescibacteria group bacterium]
MNKSKVTLPELHEHLVRTSFKDDAYVNTMSQEDKTKYFEDNFKEPEYRQDNWYTESIPVAKLVVAHPEFRSEVPLIKEDTYVSQWQAIKAQLAPHWILPYEVCATNAYPPIVAREDARGGLYRVWDGQRRTLSCLWHELATVNAYVFLEP